MIQILKIFFAHLVYSMTKYLWTKYHVKSMFLSAFVQE